MQNTRIEYDTPELVATYFIDNYTLRGLETWNKQKPVQMAYQGRINESEVQVDVDVVLLDVVKSWKGSVVLKKGSLELISKVRGLQEYAPSGTIDIDLELNAQMQEDATIVFDADGTIVLDRLQLQYKGSSLQQEKIVWQGRIEGSKAAEQQLAVSVDGKLAGSGLIHDSREKSLQMQLGAFNWQGIAGVSRQEDSFTVTMESALDGENIFVNDQQNNVALLGLEKLDIDGIRIAGLEDIQTSGVELQNLLLVEKQHGEDKKAKDKVPPLLQTAKIEINNAGMQNRNDLSIDSMNLKDVAALIHRNKEGDWQIMPTLPVSSDTAKEQPAPGAEKTAAETDPITFRIKSLQASGKNAIRFEDESLHRPFRTILHIDEFTLATVGTTGVSASAQFKVRGRVGDYGSIGFDGTIAPGAKPISLDMKGTVSSLDIPPFSSYTGKTIGYNVTSGQMDADITMNIDKGMMDSIFDLHMRNLEVARVDSDKVPDIDSQMNVPLEAALAMLRNKKDEINFKLKLKEDINNPKFGIQDAINQALAKAMKFATLSYLKYTLQPFGTFIAVAEVAGKAGKEMSKIGLDAVIFPAGEIVLDETAEQYLEKVKEVLNNRPKLRIELCGRAVIKDRAALIQKRQAVQKKEEGKGGEKQGAAAKEITIPDGVLLDFARERAELVKESLVSQYGVDHERIYLCLPELDETPDKEPMVGLFLD
jgi:hypothetical protein